MNKAETKRKHYLTIGITSIVLVFLLGMLVLTGCAQQDQQASERDVVMTKQEIIAHNAEVMNKYCEANSFKPSKLTLEKTVSDAATFLWNVCEYQIEVSSSAVDENDDFCLTVVDSNEEEYVVIVHDTGVFSRIESTSGEVLYSIVLE